MRRAGEVAGAAQKWLVVRVHEGSKAPADNGALRLAQQSPESGVHLVETTFEAYLGHAERGHIERGPPAVGRPGSPSGSEGECRLLRADLLRQVLDSVR